MLNCGCIYSCIYFILLFLNQDFLNENEKCRSPLDQGHPPPKNKGMSYSYFSYETELGEMTLVSDGKAIVTVLFGSGTLPGCFREFGGTREWKGATTLEMKPLEVIIATTRKRDDGVWSAADFLKAMDQAEGARTHRDNQLLGKEKEIEVRAKFDRNPLFNTSFKLFDGVRDVFAWSGKGKDNAMELAFKKPRTMRSLRLYGAHLEKTSVSVKSSDGWKRMEPASEDSETFSRILFFSEPVVVEALRLEFGSNPVELYEIEIPAEPVRAVVPVERDLGEGARSGD